MKRILLTLLLMLLALPASAGLPYYTAQGGSNPLAFPANQQDMNTLVGRINSSVVFLDSSGGTTSPFFNGTGANPFRVGGTTIVDSSSNATFNTANATGSNGFELGGSSVLLQQNGGNALLLNTTFDQSTEGASPTRQNVWNITLSPATDTTNIFESNFINLAINGPGQSNGEINGMHVYTQINPGGAGTGEGFECSTYNLGSIPIGEGCYLGFIHNGASSTINSETMYTGYIWNDNTTAGSITTGIVFGCSSLFGSGTKPTNYFCLRNADANALMASQGGLSLGTLASPTSGGRLLIQGTDTSSGTFPVQIKNSGSTNIFLLDNAGDLSISTQVSAPVGVFATSLKNTPIGVGGASSASVTTLTAAGAVNLNVGNNAATNIGTGTTTSAVTIGGSGNTTALNSSTVTAASLLTSLHYGGNGTAPTILQGTGSGNSGTTTGLDASAHDSSFTVSFTSGATPTASAAIATVTFATAYANAPHCVFSPTTAGADALNATSAVFETMTTTTWVLTAGSTALTNAVAYGWSVKCEQ